MLIRNPGAERAAIMNTSAFNVKTSEVPADKLGILLNSVMLADKKSANAVTKLDGHVRIPDPSSSFNDTCGKKPEERTEDDIKVLYGYQEPGPRKNVIQLTVPGRAALANLILSYYKQIDAASQTIYYTKIVYAGHEPNDWKYYGKLMVDYIDYILPYMRKYMDDRNLNERDDHTRIVKSEHLVYTDHLYTKTGNSSFHLIYTADTSTGFTELWEYYLRYLAFVKPETKVSQEDGIAYRQEEKAAEEAEKSAVNNGGEEQKNDSDTSENSAGHRSSADS